MRSLRNWINIALPKGRLGEKAYDIFEQIGYGCPSIHEGGRKLIFENEENITLLKQTPSAYLGSCRYKLADREKDDTVYKKIVQCFKRRQIGAFFYIGGNDSMDTVNKIATYLKQNNINDIFVVGAPKTIDNDLVETDHCPGFGSAAKYIATSIREIVRDSVCYGVKHSTVAIVEVMGRHAGWLTASAALSKPFIIPLAIGAVTPGISIETASTPALTHCCLAPS